MVTKLGRLIDPAALYRRRKMTPKQMMVIIMVIILLCLVRRRRQLCLSAGMEDGDVSFDFYPTIFHN
jgi:hypothetical protein